MSENIPCEPDLDQVSNNDTLKRSSTRENSEEKPANFSADTMKWPLNIPPMLLRTRRTSLPKLQVDRLLGHTSRYSVQRQCQLTSDQISRLGVSAELQGHGGCVNCIEFNDNGRLLVSGSDDCQLLLWDVHSRRKLRAYTTTHSGNIFSVKFLPSCGTGLLVSGAGDKKIEVRDISTSRTLHTCTCHSNRVKRLATSPHLQHTFFSAAEDGTVLQYDLRAPHQCERLPSNVVVDLRTIRMRGQPSEVKCAALSPRDPHMLAVGANDPYVRIYDRRMIKLSKMQSHRSSSESDMEDGGVVMGNPLPQGCCQYFVPGHLPVNRERQRQFRSLATTYLSYSPSGEHLLANLGGENIYLYDTCRAVPPVVYTSPAHLSQTPESRGPSNSMQEQPSNGVTGSSSNGFYVPSTTTSPPSPPSPSSSPLPSRVESLKERALEHYKTESWASAVMLYSEALQAAPQSALLFRNRAAVLQKRNWEGDAYAALRDCFKALALEPQHPKAYQRMAKCLHKLGRFEEAKLCMEDFRRCHAEQSQSPACKRLYTDILNGVFQSSAGNGSTSNSNTNGSNGTIPSSDDNQSKILQQERLWRLEASDYVTHYAGHCNTTTDIKEAVFLGQSGEFVAAGSDDGNLFIWETATGNLVRLMPADENIVNCVQCHPSTSMVVTSGIGHTVKIWEPLGESQLSNDADMIQTTHRNQTRMNEDPLEMLFMHMGDLTHVFSSHELGRGRGRGSVGLSIFRRGGENEGDDDEDDDDEPVPQHAFEFLRIPRPDAGGGGSGSAGEGDAAAGGPDVQCRTC